jgi:hypothetical protein
MYTTLIVYSQIYVKIYIKNRGETAVIEKDVYKDVLQRAGWALPRTFFCIYNFFLTIKKHQFGNFIVTLCMLQSHCQTALQNHDIKTAN